MRSLEKRDALLESARGLALRAAAARPGWAPHRMLAAKLLFLAERRKGFPNPPETWLAPMRSAAREAASVADEAFLAGALLESWAKLSPAEREALPAALATAFVDPSSVARLVPPAVAALGEDAAARLVPDEPRLLRALAEERAAAGDLDGAAAAWKRFDAAEGRARARDLAGIEERSRMGDVDGARRLCRAWMALHPVRERDTEEGRREAARVLELWPEDAGGSFRRDARGDLVRYFLDGREAAVPGAALARAVAALSDVPEPVRARIAVLADDRYAWERVLATSEATGTLEWTPFHLDVARRHLADGNPGEAREALGRISPAARAECSVLLVRREAARAERRAGRTPGDDEGALADELARTRRRLAEARELSPSGQLPVCVDPETDGVGSLRVRLRMPGPALVAWGWNGGSAAREGAEGEVELVAPLAGIQGRAFFTTRVLAGPAPALVSASIDASASSSWRLQQAAASAAPATQASVAGMAGRERSNSTRP